MVTIVFTDATTVTLTIKEAIDLCSDSTKNGFIIDALTPDRELQSYLRDLMEIGHN